MTARTKKPSEFELPALNSTLVTSTIDKSVVNMTRDSYFPHLSQRQIIDESAVSEKDSQFQGLSRKKQSRFVDSVVVSSLAEEEEDLI